jgi:hypothetical protein
LSGRDGFETLSAGFGVFVEMKCIFFTTLEAENFSKSSRKLELERINSEKKQRRTEVTGVTGRGLGTTGASGQCQ